MKSERVCIFSVNGSTSSEVNVVAAAVKIALIRRIKGHQSQKISC